MNYSFLKSFLKPCLFGGFVLAISASYMAATAAPLSTLNSDIIGGYSLNYLNPRSDSESPNLYMFTQSPSYDNTKVVKFFYNQYATGIKAPNDNAAGRDTNASIFNSITASTKNSSLLLKKAMDQFFPLYVGGKHTYKFSKNKVHRGKKDESNINALNLDTLLEPVEFSGATKTEAAEFIKYITNQYYPAPRISFEAFAEDSDGKKLTEALRSNSVQKYLYLIRRVAALDSVGQSNLYYLYGERLPQRTDKLLKNLPSSVAEKALPKNLQKKASPLALEKWIATHRLSSTKSTDGTTPWVKSIENASPATLQRETVYLLAEIQQALFKQRMLTERLLATTSVEQLQSGGFLSIQLQTLQRSICSSKPFEGSSACPSRPAPANPLK